MTALASLGVLSCASEHCARVDHPLKLGRECHVDHPGFRIASKSFNERTMCRRYHKLQGSRPRSIHSRKPPERRAIVLMPPMPTHMQLIAIDQGG
jgi:hypothetical protein